MQEDLDLSTILDRIGDFYQTSDYANTLLVQCIPDAKKFIPSKSVCGKFHGVKKRQNVVFELARIIESPGERVGLLRAFEVAYLFFAQNYLFCNKNDEMQLPRDFDGYKSYNNIGQRVIIDAWDSLSEDYKGEVES